MSEKFANKLINMQLISSEEKDIYSYGFKQGFLLLLNIITIIVVGFIFNMVWQTIIFMAAYSFIRGYAGGYHANTPFACYLFSIAMIAAVLWIIKLIPWNSFICFIIVVVSSILILLIGPVEDSNKPLDLKEKEIFKKRTNINLSVLIGVILFFWFTGGKQISIIIAMGICMISVMLVLGRIKNMNLEEVHNNIETIQHNLNSK